MGVDRADLAGDVLEAQRGPSLEQVEAEGLRAGDGDRAVPQQPPARGDELGKLAERFGAQRPALGLEERAEAGEHGGIGPIGLGELAGRLGRASGPMPVDLGAGRSGAVEALKAV